VVNEKAGLKPSIELVRIDPANPEYWKLLARKYRERGRVRTARRMFEKAERIPDLARTGPPSPVY